MSDFWLKCSACKKELGFAAIHWVCSVSTCNRSRTRLVFCSVSCWDSHVADARHRDAWAVEARSPSREAWRLEQAQDAAARPPTTSSPASAPRPAPAPAPIVRPSGSGSAPSSAPPAPRRIITAETPASPAATTSPATSVTLASGVEEEVLVVVSKMKKYIRDRSGMNCSDAVADALSVHLRAWCDDAIRTAAADGRKTVLERDVGKPRG